MYNKIPVIPDIYGKITDISLKKENYSYKQLFDTLISENQHSKLEDHSKHIVVKNIKDDINNLINENNGWKKIIYDEIINETDKQEINNEYINIKDACILKNNNQVLNGRTINNYEDIINLMKIYNENINIINSIKIDSTNIMEIIMKEIQKDFLGQIKKNSRKLEKIIYQEIYNQLKFYIINQLSGINSTDKKKQWAKNALEYTQLKYTGSSNQTIKTIFKEKEIAEGRDHYFGRFIDELLSSKHSEINPNNELIINESEGINEEEIYINNIENFQQRCKAIIQDNNYIEYQAGRKIINTFGKETINLSKK